MICPACEEKKKKLSNRRFGLLWKGVEHHRQNRLAGTSSGTCNPGHHFFFNILVFFFSAGFEFYPARKKTWGLLYSLVCPNIHVPCHFSATGSPKNVYIYIRRSMFLMSLFTFLVSGNKPWSQVSSSLPPPGTGLHFIAKRVQHSQCSSIFMELC